MSTENKTQKLFIIHNRRTRKTWRATANEVYFYSSNKFGNIRDVYLIGSAETNKMVFIEDILQEIDRNRIFINKIKAEAKKDIK